MYFTKSFNVVMSDLYLAYFVAREWISRDYPEYLAEEWMQNSEFLDNVSKTHSVVSQEASNI